MLLGFALFIILNDCIGLSSAPFYLPNVGCNPIEPSWQCNKLKNLSQAIYIIEMIGGFSLSIQAIGLYYLIENKGNPIASNKIKHMTRIFLAIYSLIWVTRITLFIIMIYYAEEHIENGIQISNYGVFLGNFAFTKGG